MRDRFRGCWKALAAGLKIHVSEHKQASGKLDRPGMGGPGLRSCQLLLASCTGGQSPARPAMTLPLRDGHIGGCCTLKV